MAEEITDAEYKKRFNKALSEGFTEEEKARSQGIRSNPLALAKSIFIDSARDVIGPRIEREGITGAIPGFGGRGDISPEDRAAEILKAMRAREKKEARTKKEAKKKRQRIKENPSLYKGFKKGGKVRGAGIARKGVRPAKMR